MYTVFKTLKRTVKTDVPVSLRSKSDELKYATSKKLKLNRPLHEEPHLKKWNHWALIDNSFPYSAAFKVHHMLIPRRVVKEEDLSKSERLELTKILDELHDVYDCYQVNFLKKQSVRNHYHIHLLAFKDSRSELHF